MKQRASDTIKSNLKQLTKFDELRNNPNTCPSVTFVLDEALQAFISEDVDEVKDQIYS